MQVCPETHPKHVGTFHGVETKTIQKRESELSPRRLLSLLPDFRCVVTSHFMCPLSCPLHPDGLYSLKCQVKKNLFCHWVFIATMEKCLIYHQDLKSNYRSSEMVWWVIPLNKSNDLSSILRAYMVGKNRLSKVFLWPPHMSHAICPPNQYNF